MCDRLIPSLILIGGPPGSGKTTLATALARNLKIPIIDKDTIKSTLLGLGVQHELASKASYELLLPLVSDILAAGVTIIIDAPGKYRSFLERCEEVTSANNAVFRTIICHVGRDIQEHRLRQREPRSSQWAALPEDFHDTLESWLEIFPPGTFVLDTNDEPQHLVELVLPGLELRRATFLTSDNIEM